ncbi:MAG: TonB-dependent receptor [Tannerella sp.]|jgi:TonB-linked SusC/RagA family outer membrane protein|nr:TonB-dependent receptor [Tannerella sp.]
MKKKNRLKSANRLFCTLAIGLLGLLAPAGLSAQNTGNRITVTGEVRDAQGPIAGATVMEKGSATNGVITDASGQFSIQAGAKGSLTVSYLGYTTQDVALRGRSHLSIELQEAATNLNEVVVVGYGTQKKVNLTGSVASVNYDQSVLSRPLTTATAALAGMSSGLQVMQGSGRPNAEGISLRIRGTGTLNDSDPLVLVDGVEQDLSNINPQDIASISVLKDAASCAIYGNRGANGVILVTTKTGRNGKIQVSYNGMLAINNPTKVIRMVSNSADYFELMNESAENVGASPIFAQSTIDMWRKADKDPKALAASGYPNYVAYPNTDWFDAIFKTRIMHQHTVSVTGQEKHTNYDFSATYLDNPGIVDNAGIKKYYFRSNIAADVKPWMQVGMRLWGYQTDQQRNDIANLTAWSFQKTVPDIYPRYQGLWGGPSAPEEDPVASNGLLIMNNNGGSYKYREMNASFYAQIKFLKDFSFKTNFNYDYFHREDVYISGSNDRWNFRLGTLEEAATPLSQVGVYYYYDMTKRWKWTNTLNWSHTYNNLHYITALAGFEEENYWDRTMDSEKQGVIDLSVTDFDTVNTMMYLHGNGSAWARRSWFGRATYAYNEKYLFEADMRYDGSSRFAPDRRWGFFPSASAAWRISQEGFMQNSGIDNLKLRLSYGRLGNSSIGDYEWQSLYNTNYYSFGGTKATGLDIGTYANPLLVWEHTDQLDAGLDFGFLKNRFSAVFDFYNKQTNGILYRPDMYLTMGNTTGPLENLAEVNNRGVELTLSWADKIGKVHYSVSGNVSYNRNLVNKYKGKLKQGWVTDANGNKVWQSNLGDVSTGDANRVIEGHTINEWYMLDTYKGNASYFNKDGSVNPKGGPKDGMIRTPEDMKWLQAMSAAGYKFYPDQGISKDKIWYGDYIYADNDGDGIYGDTNDRTFQGCSTEPKYIYGLQAAASWNNFDISVNLSGAAGNKVYWYAVGQNGSATVFGLAIGKEVGYHHYFYDPDNPDDPRTNTSSNTPRLTLNNGNDQSGAQSNLHLFNAGFLKLQNVTFGYTLPKLITDKLQIEKVRFYLSGEDLLTFTSFPGIDPEMRAGVGYAPLRQFAFGLNVTF